MPRVTFTDPEVGAVGLTEAQAREQGMTVRTGVTQVPPAPAAGSTRPATTVSSSWSRTAAAGVLAGATSAGPRGGEVLSALVVAVHARVPVRRLREMIYAYPTFHRAIEDALAALGPQARGCPL